VKKIGNVLKRRFNVKRISVFIIIGLLMISSIPVSILASSEDAERNEIIGLFGSMLVPSIFSSAKSDKFAGSIYGRTITGEGEAPDFNGDIKGKIDSYQIYINGRIGGFGATIGFGQGNAFEFSQPLILSVDYKIGLLDKIPVLDAAIDAQYTMIYLPNEKTIKVSAPGFGIVSINGLVGADLILIEPYAGVTVNYVYLDSAAKLYSVWKAIPKLGLKLKILPFVSVGGELAYITNKTLNNSLVWNFGASVRF
jgi:hypothetical protein